jgi:hypothetical protein
VKTAAYTFGIIAGISIVANVVIIAMWQKDRKDWKEGKPFPVK